MTATPLNSVRQLTKIPNTVWGGVALLLLISLAFVLSDFQKTIASEMLIIGLFSLSLNLIMGYGGMVHFGHAAFYALGGYTLAVGTARFGWSPWVGMLLAPFVSAAVAVVIGWFSVRRIRLYFAILTLAFGQMVYVAIFQTRELTGGDDGLHGLVMPEIISTPGNYYLFTLAVFTVCFLLIRMIVRSPFVVVLRAIRENPERAQFIGVDVRRHQLIVFVVGAFFAGIAGALIVGEQHFAGVEMAHWTTSAEPILGSLLGGMYSLVGPVFGGALLVFLNLTLTRITPYWPLVLGTLTVVIVLVAPTGLIGLIQRILGTSSKEVDG